MRLWSLHPAYLDSRGLVALWREALLAQAVLVGRTKGYRRHPQLSRFRDRNDPPASIAAYLKAVHEEATARGYNFDAGRIVSSCAAGRIDVPAGQIALEWTHLMKKLADRAPGTARALGLRKIATPAPAVPDRRGRGRGLGKAVTGAVRYAGSKPSGRCHSE